MPTSLPPHSRWLLQSRVATIAILLLFYLDPIQGTSFVHAGDATPALWFTARQPGHLQLDEQAFYNNMSTVVREIRSDGAQVLLLSYQGNPFDRGDQEVWRRYYDHEERMLQRVAQEQSVLFAPFPLAEMPLEVWVDPSHINEQGELIKAAYVYRQLVPGLAELLQAAPAGHATGLVLDLP